MDTKTLIIAGLVVALAVSFSMVLVFWTRRTYPGFGYWLAGSVCRALSAALFLLPRDQFPPWLTIILANYLLFAELILYLRGTLIFRGQPVRVHWDVAGSLIFLVAFFWFTYVEPSRNARVGVGMFLIAIWSLRLCLALLTRRPPYFGSFDRWQAGIWAVLTLFGLMRAIYVGILAPPLPDYLTSPASQSEWILLLILTSILVTLSQVVMNTQRLEYDLRRTREALEEDVRERERIEGELRAAKARLEATINTLPDLLLRVDREGRGREYRTAEPGRLFLPPAEFLGRPVTEFLPTEAARVVLAALEEAERKGYHRGASYSLPTPQGPTWYELSIARLGGATADDGEYIMLIRDITDRQLAEEQLRLSEGRHRLLAENALDVIWTLEPDGTLSYVSPAVEKLRGFTPAEALRQAPEEVLTPASLANYRRYFEEVQTRARSGLPLEPFRGELEYRCRDGSTVWGDVMVYPQQDADGALRQLLGVSRDISERKRHEFELRQARDLTERANQALQAANAELQRLATTDTLTGVWNRRHFEQVVAAEIQRAGRYGEPLSLLLFDIDHFKAINDTHGHLVGDQVLIGLSHRVRDHLRDVDILARWGGEEFVVMLPHCDGDQARHLAEKLRALIAAEPFPGVGQVTSSFGVAQFRPPESADAWLNRADDALYRAKAAGRNRVWIASD
jgi:diguanylate cyclase (GGDEF)-like protein/PAS domain S-box-containing protein